LRPTSLTRCNNKTTQGSQIKQEEQMLIRLTLNWDVNCRVLFSANPVTLTEGQRSPNWCTLVLLMKLHNPTKFEEFWYHSLRKTANVKILDNFERTWIISPWIQNNRVKLIYMNYFHFGLYPHKVSSLSSQWLRRYAIRPLLCFADPVTLSKGQRSPKITHTCSVDRR